MKNNCLALNNFFFRIQISTLIFSQSIFSDYDAPITENGAYTPKYDKAAEMIAAYDSLANVISKPERPEYNSPQAYPNVKLNQYLSLEQLLDNVV